MAVPITGAKLSDVKSNIEGGGGGTVTSLKDAHDNEAIIGGYNPTYVVGGYDSLRDFRDYDHVTIPSTPTGLVETADSNTSVTMSWNASAGATYYEITNVSLTTTINVGNVTSYEYTGLDCSTSYFINVAACNGAGCSAVSSNVLMATNTDVTTTPTSLVKDSSTDTTISMSWTPSTTTCGTVINYYVSIDGGVDINNGTSTTYTATGLDCAATSYEFKVRAKSVTAGAYSSYSTPVNMATNADTTAPSQVTGFVRTGQSTSTISTAWNASTDDCSSVTYQMRLNAGLKGSTTNLTYTYTGLAAGTSYLMSVAPYDSSSNFATNTTLTKCTLCVAPTLSFVSKTDTTITVSWNSVTGASSYTLYWRQTNGSNWIPITSATSPYTKTALAPEVSHDFKVVAINSCGDLSADSNTVVQTTDAAGLAYPYNISATHEPQGPDQIDWDYVRVAWTAADDLGFTLASYTLWGAVNQTTSWTVRATGITGTNTLQAEQSQNDLYYRIQAIGTGGEKSPSNADMDIDTTKAAVQAGDGTTPYPPTDWVWYDVWS